MLRPLYLSHQLSKTHTPLAIAKQIIGWAATLQVLGSISFAFSISVFPSPAAIVHIPTIVISTAFNITIVVLFLKYRHSDTLHPDTLLYLSVCAAVVSVCSLLAGGFKVAHISTFSAFWNESAKEVLLTVGCVLDIMVGIMYIVLARVIVGPETDRKTSQMSVATSEVRFIS